jgi:hypothetical protein
VGFANQNSFSTNNKENQSVQINPVRGKGGSRAFGTALDQNRTQDFVNMD